MKRDAIATVGLFLTAYALWSTPVSLAQSSESLFRIDSRESVSLSDDSAFVEIGRLTVETDHLQSMPQSLNFPLLDDRSYQATRWHVERRGPRHLVWRGHIHGGGQVTLTLFDEHIMGVIEVPSGLYEMSVNPEGEPILARVDSSRFGACGSGVDRDTSGQSTLATRIEDSSRAASPSVENIDPANQVDLLTLYTPQARTGAGSHSLIQATIQAAVDISNTAFMNSGMVVRFRSVHVEQAARNDSANSQADLNWLRNDLRVQALRDRHRADMVGLIVENAEAGICGRGNLMGPAASADSGFQVTERGCAVSNRTFAHEHGHNMGLQHHPESGDNPTFLSYAAGHFVDGVFRTVMATTANSCTNCPRVGHFSNPDIGFNGQPTGIANQRDNARASDVSAPSVANWRRSDLPPPQRIILREGNNGTQDVVCELSATRQRINFKNHPCPNDEARSMQMMNVDSGFTVRLYDSPDCKTDDDWTEIKTLQDVLAFTVNTFEQSMNNGSVRVTYHPDNGLDGKVSCFHSFVCGDNICESPETCNSCPADCGQCMVCGDGVCSSSEDCFLCAQDCGACPCDFDGVCDLDEDFDPSCPDCFCEEEGFCPE